MTMTLTGRLWESMKKYGMVEVGVHLSVSIASITGLYVAIKNVFQKVGLPSGLFNKDPSTSSSSTTVGAPSGDPAILLDSYDAPSPPPVEEEKKSNKKAEMAASSGGALALAILCNKAFFPVKVPITTALTTPIVRFLAKRKLIKTHV